MELYQPIRCAHVELGVITGDQYAAIWANGDPVHGTIEAGADVKVVVQAAIVVQADQMAVRLPGPLGEMPADQDVATRHEINHVQSVRRIYVSPNARVEAHVQCPIRVQAGHAVTCYTIECIETADHHDLSIGLQRQIHDQVIRTTARIEGFVHAAITVQPCDAPPRSSIVEVELSGRQDVTVRLDQDVL